MEAFKRYFVPLVLLASLLGRGLYALHTGGVLIYPDEHVYHELALKMFSPDWAGLFHSREPLYPALVWLTYAVTGPNPLAVKLVQAALSTLAVYLVYKTALELFGRGAARMALLAAAFYPFTVFYDSRLLRESLLFLLGTTSLYFALKPSGSRTFNLCAASLLAGLGAMAKSILLFYWLPLVLAALLLKKVSPGAALAAGASFMLAVSPLLAYNYRHTGALFLTRGQMFNLYTPLVAPREILGTPGENAYMAADPLFSAGMALPEAERDAYFKTLVMRQLTDRPWNFIKRTVWRFAKLWRPVPHRGIDYEAGGWALLAAVSLLSDGWLLPLGLWGAFSLRRRFAQLYPAYIYVAALAAIYSLSWSQIRYRLHLMPVFILLASPLLAAAAGRILDFFKEDLEKC